MKAVLQIPSALQSALAHHQAGRLPEAEAIYRQILKAQPNHPDALHLLGMIAYQTGKNDIAVELISKAISAESSNPIYYSNLGNALQAQGKLDAAATSYRKALALKSDYADAHYNLGTVLTAQSRLDDAVESYRKALELKPDHAEAHNNLGTVLKGLGRLNDAVKSYREVLALKPDDPGAHNNLGDALTDLGEFDAAVDHCRQALALEPDFADAHNNLGNALQAQGKLDAAVESYRQAFALKPNFAEAHNNLGNAFKDMGQLDVAVESYRNALAFKPDYAEAHNNLGTALRDLGQLDAAVESYRKALVLKPDYAEAHNNLGNVLQAQGNLDAAVESYRKALVLKRDFAEAHNNLGTALRDLGQLGAAVESFHQALALKPDFTEAHNNLGNTLQDLGELDAAMECYRKALELRPDYADAYGNLLFCLNYHPDLSAEDIFAEYRGWNERIARPLLHRQVHANARDPLRRLRIGYVSADLRQHSARHAIEPLLAHHDKAQVEVFAYSGAMLEDGISARFKGYVDHWQSTVGMSDEALAELIRGDGIDILVDMAGHTAGNRLLVFARKPAPIQVSSFGYGYTTGLEAMDYFLGEEEFTPPGCESLFAEELVRLPVIATYRPAEGMGESGPLPALQGKGVTFGTLSRSVRINHRVIRTWAGILNRLPEARLVINSGSFRDAGMQVSMHKQFGAYGIAEHRLVLGFDSPPWDVLRAMDISLDCFPHNSGTTLSESLYMGVPYVTLAGRPSVGRIGASVLKTVGHPEWIATSEEDYIDKAVALATDMDRLVLLRGSLRGQMQQSPLMDEAAYVRAVEAAYRSMWQRWCKGTPEL